MQTYFNVIVLALEGFPSFLSTWTSYLHSQPSELPSPKQETTSENHFLFCNECGARVTERSPVKSWGWDQLCSTLKLGQLQTISKEAQWENKGRRRWRRDLDGGSYRAYPVIKYYNREENFFVVATELCIIQINGQTHLKGRPEFLPKVVVRK